MQSVIRFIDEVSTWVGKIFGWSIVILTAATSYEVFSRYVLGAPTEWAFDAAYMMYGTLFMMSGAYALARNIHVRGDWVYRTWSDTTQAKMDLVLYFIFFYPGILALIYSGYVFAEQSWMMKEHSSFSPNGPPVYHFKSLIPITGGLLLMQGIGETLRCLLCIRDGKWPQRLHDVEELENQILREHAADAVTK